MVSELEEPSIKIINEPLKSKNPLVIGGFPGIGLVGNIACQHIIEELGMKYVGSIDSKYFPPVAVLFNGMVYMPVRIYEDEKSGIVIVIADIPIHPTASYDVSRALVSWIKSINAKHLVSIAGIATTTGEKKVFGGATNPEMLELIKDKTEIFQVGTISGISGSIMTECFLQGVPAISLLGETGGPNPDPRASIEVLNVMNNVFGLSINTEKLIVEAESIEHELSKLAEQVQTTETTPTTGKEYPMYG